jgi:hypothetical protein
LGRSEQRGTWLAAEVYRNEEPFLLYRGDSQCGEQPLGMEDRETCGLGGEAGNRLILPPAMHRLLLTKKLPLSLAELATESTAQERRAGNF